MTEGQSVEDDAVEWAEMALPAGLEALRSVKQDVEKVTYQPGEGVTAFSVRRIQHDAWTEGHAACEWAGLAPDSSCPRHPSPYADASRFPSGEPS